METIMVPIYQITPYENNPRLNNGAAEKVAESIKAFGFRSPILLDENNIIIAGHTRLKAAEMLGLEEVPCIRYDDMPPELVKAYRLADNKTAEFADWDLAKLNVELQELAVEFPDLDMEKFGFFELPEIDIDDYLKENPTDDEEDAAEEPKKVQCPYCGEWFDVL